MESPSLHRINRNRPTNGKKVLITDGVHPTLIEGFVALGFGYDYHPKITLEKVKLIIQDYDGVIINSKIIVDKDFLDKAIRLKFIGRLGSGMEIINQPYARQKGVAVFSAPEGNCNAVAEHALGMLLALANKFRTGDTEVRQMIWQREANRGFEIMGKTVGIIGFGHTGSQLAKKLAGMGVKILAYDKYKPAGYALDYGFITETTPEQIFQDADIVSLHLPLNPETKHFADYTWMKQFKKPIVLINTSRGNVIPTKDLIRGLEEGIIRGACLDVFENEKPLTFSEAEKSVFNHLYEFENVILTPHVAGWTIQSLERLASVLLTKITNFLEETQPFTTV
ncbi:MAG: NAD(P)-dependent oxidoreductase [Saprospiraceae bacterium]